MADREPVAWITVHGRRVPIFEGESKADAIKRVVNKDTSKSTEMIRKQTEEQKVIQNNDDEKEKQIKRNQTQADTANSQTVKDNLGRNQNSHEFNKSIIGAKASRPIIDRWRVDVHTPQEYQEKGCKMWTSNGGSTIAVTKDGDIISVCKNANDESMSGSSILQRAVSMGGKKLDSFSGNHNFYTKNGFEPVSWVKFDERYAPDGWKESGCARESVIFYKYVGKGNVKYAGLKGLKEFKTKTQPFRGKNAYDDAYDYRDKHI